MDFPRLDTQMNNLVPQIQLKGLNFCIQFYTMYSILWNFKGKKSEDANDDQGLPKICYAKPFYSVVVRKTILLSSCKMQENHLLRSCTNNAAAIGYIFRDRSRGLAQ